VTDILIVKAAIHYTLRDRKFFLGIHVMSTTNKI